MMVQFRVWLSLALVGAFVTWGLADGHGPADDERVKLVGSIEIHEKLDGKDSQVTFAEVTIAPGKDGSPHRHPGPVFVYVLEGEYELGIDDQPIQRFKAGQTFYEPAGCLHRVSRNPGKKQPARLLAVIVHPRDAKEIAVPDAHGH